MWNRRSFAISRGKFNKAVIRIYKGTPDQRFAYDGTLKSDFKKRVLTFKSFKPNAPLIYAKYARKGTQ